MPLSHIDHFLIQSVDLDATRDWYVDNLGMTEGWHPDFKFPVIWLYLGDAPVLHLCDGGARASANRLEFLGQQSQATEGSGVIDHVAFRATGLKETMAHLDAQGVDYKSRQVSNEGLFQLFMFDPNGVKVELNFDQAEAAHINAELMATELAE